MVNIQIAKCFDFASSLTITTRMGYKSVGECDCTVSDVYFRLGNYGIKRIWEMENF